VAADDPLHQAFVGEVVDAPACTVPLASGIDHGDIPGVALFEEPPLDGAGECFGVPGANEAADGDGCAVWNARDGLVNRLELSGHLVLLNGALGALRTGRIACPTDGSGRRLAPDHAPRGVLRRRLCFDER